MNDKRYGRRKEWQQAFKNEDQEQENLLKEMAKMLKDAAAVRQDKIRQPIIKDINRLVKAVEFGESRNSIKPKMDKIAERITKGK